VIIPFGGDERANPKHLASWAKQKKVHPDEFEIVVCHQTDKVAIEELRRELRPNDTLFSVPDEQGKFFSGKEMALYREGSARAQGQYLLLSEDHVIATPLCLSAILNELRKRPGHDGFALGCGHINRTLLSRAEASIYNQSVRHWYDPSNWDRVRQRGTVIRRDLLEKVGGIPENFGLFGELLLSMRLWKAGAFIEYLPTALIRHVNLYEFSVLEHEIENFICGEIDFLREATVADTAFFGVREGTRQALFLHRSHLRSVREALATLKRKGLRQFSPHGRSGIARLRRQVIYQSCIPAKLREWSRLIRKKYLLLGVYLAAKNPETCRRRMLHLWNLVAENAALAYVENLSLPFAAISIDSPRLLEDLPAMSTFGFHAMESGADGAAFRWTSSVSGLYLELEPGPYQVTLELAPYRHPASSVPFIPFFDGSPLGTESVHHGSEEITMIVTAKHFGSFPLLWISDPMKAKDDPRDLSLPVRGIQLRRKESSS